MKRKLMLLLLALPAIVSAQSFADYFEDKTLRIDYTFSGNKDKQDIYVDELHATPRWYGKRNRLAEVPYKGNGQIIVKDAASELVIYRHSFSSLFQEWLSTAEAGRVSKSFENVFLIPYPKQPVTVTVELYDFHMKTTAALTHGVEPHDILIQQERQQTDFQVLQQADDTTHCIHIAYVAEGYTKEEMPDFIHDCQIAVEALFEHEPFRSQRGRFNLIAVCSPSDESGTSIPHKGVWKSTALHSHFDTFYSNRYLTTLHLKRLHDVLSGTPYEHIIILVNTDNYGGGGIYNSYNLSYTKGTNFRPVVVHEFGHSFGGLGDEYAYGDDDPMYFADTEPWEPNLTTKHDFHGKWENLMATGAAGLYEGGGYMTHGVWRGSEDCRMKTNEYPEFCAVCQQALKRLIDFYTTD